VWQDCQGAFQNRHSFSEQERLQHWSFFGKLTLEFAGVAAKELQFMPLCGVMGV